MTAGGGAEIAQHGLADPPAEFMAVDIGAAEVNSAPDARIVDLLGDGGEAIETCASRQTPADSVTLTRTLSVLSSPRNTASAAPEKHACADGYSGCGGVPSSGSQAASPASVGSFQGGSRSDRRNRPPVQAIILVLEAGDLGVRDGNRQEGEEAQIVEHSCLALSGRRPCCRKPWYPSLYRPKHGCRRLIGSPHATVPRAKQLHLIEVGLELRAVQAEAVP